MIPTEQFPKEFYTQLANLFYAIAMADGKFVIEEKKKIKTIVEKHWNTILTNESSSNLIYSRLKELINNGDNLDVIYSIFKDFYFANPNYFSNQTKNKILHSLDEVAMGFSNKNKSELIFLSRIQLLFEK